MDLLGAANPQFFNFYANTQTLHNKLRTIEQELQKSAKLEGHNRMFLSRQAQSNVDDDHRPFLQRSKCIPFLYRYHIIVYYLL